MFARLENYFRSRPPRTRRFAAGAGFILAAMLASVSLFATGPASDPAVRTEKAWPVSVLTVAPSDIRPTFGAYGRVESSNVTHLKTDLNAEVDTVAVREGDWVEAGDVLITLSDRELRLNLMERRAELARLTAEGESIRLEQALLEESTAEYRSMAELARKKLHRHEDLIAKRLISQALLDEVLAQANQAEIAYQTHMRSLADFPNRLAAQQAAAERAEAHVRMAELDIEKTRIVAPFRGPVLGVFVAPGDRSNIAATLADVANADTFEVRVQIPARYGARLHENLGAGHSVAAVTAAGTRLRLSRLSGRVRSGQSGIDAFFEFDQADDSPETALGRLLELTITLPAESAVVALPVQSLYENDRVYTVRTDAEQRSRLEAIAVERVGEVQDAGGEHRVLVRSPAIRTGDRIITTQLPRVSSGLLVEPA
jgi:HlyD family secretion protein